MSGIGDAKGIDIKTRDVELAVRKGGIGGLPGSQSMFIGSIGHAPVKPSFHRSDIDSTFHKLDNAGNALLCFDAS